MELLGSIPAVEFALWLAFYQQHGFDTDRLEWVTANAGSAAAQSMGAKVKPKELIPNFSPVRRASDIAVIMNFFDRVGVK